MVQILHPPKLDEQSVYRTVFGYFPYADGAGRNAAVEFNPTIRLSSASGLITTQEPYRIALDEMGRFQVDLLVTDSNPHIYPNGWCWEVREDFKGGNIYWFLLPLDDGSPIGLSSISPIPEKPPIIGLSAGPRGPVGPDGADGDPGRDGAFLVWRQQEQPDPYLDPVSPGDLWFEMDPPPPPIEGEFPDG